MQQSIYRKASGLEFDYLIYQPQKPAATPLPLLIFLHGSGERGTDLELLKCHSVPKLADAPEFDLPAIVVCPQINSQTDIWSYNLDKLAHFVKELIDRYPVDPNRVSLTGISIGGYGTWEAATRYPELFAAIAPVCGGGHPFRASFLKQVKIRAFHGTADSVVPPHCSTDMVEAVNAAGGQAELTLYHGVGHNAWDPAYSQSDVLSWLIAQKREG